MKHITRITGASALALALAACASYDTAEDADETVVMASADEALCLTMGPQTPRDISSVTGLNSVMFDAAPPASEMNLCNIHTHTNAEHKGPGFSIFVDDSDYGGYACNATAELTAAELTAAPGAYGKVAPGDTIEVHWVHTTCDSDPGEGLGACVPEGCENPLLRVEAQTFLVVNDSNALDFTTMGYRGFEVNGLDQAKMIPASTGTPVTFRGSTTGPSYDQSVCSPAQVTWSVRPQCAKVDINSLHRWAEMGNVFNETASHGVRQLVTAPELLSPIE
ncbi:MAG: delta-class carbonic anhydrase [Litorimonas sp.]